MGIELIPLAAVAAGGALGALSRYGVYQTVDSTFPLATFIVNIVGCCLASYLMFAWGIHTDTAWKTLVFTGFFGAFTTMSTFSIDTVNLMADGSWGLAGFNIAINAFLCVGGAALGRYLALL